MTAFLKKKNNMSDFYNNKYTVYMIMVCDSISDIRKATNSWMIEEENILLEMLFKVGGYLIIQMCSPQAHTCTSDFLRPCSKHSQGENFKFHLLTF